jgi:hypothetical protein
MPSSTKSLMITCMSSSHCVSLRNMQQAGKEGNPSHTHVLHVPVAEQHHSRDQCVHHNMCCVCTLHTVSQPPGIHPFCKHVCAAVQAVLAERETKLAAAEEAARAATVAARDRAAAAQSAQQEVERAMTAQRQQLEQVSVDYGGGCYKWILSPLGGFSPRYQQYVLSSWCLSSGVGGVHHRWGLWYVLTSGFQPPHRCVATVSTVLPTESLPSCVTHCPSTCAHVLLTLANVIFI